MKSSKFILVIIIIVFLAILIVTIVNTIFEFRPLYEFTYLIEKQYSAWIISLSLLVCISLSLVLLINIKKKRSQNERTELFELTIHAVQDILQNSSSRLQNIILDMEEQKVSGKLIKSAQECLDENIRLIQFLSKLDPNNIGQYYDKNLSSLILEEKMES
jgi:uncharacterized membrane protein